MTTVARVSGPADLAATVPEILGFTPAQSLVVLSLHEPRGRLGMTMRFDLAAAEHLAEEVPERLLHDGASRTVLVVYTEEAGELPYGEVVDALVRGVEAAGIRLSEALLVRGGLWSSYTCSARCCPRSGSPLAPADVGVPGLIAAERVLAGRVRYASREELEQSLRPVLPLGGEPARVAELRQVAEAMLDAVVEDRGRVERREVRKLRRALVRGGALTPESAARMAVAVRLPGVRDAVSSWIPDEAGEVVALMTAVLRWTPHEEAGCVLRVLGTAAYAQGQGALARIALEAAAEADGPGTFADTLLEALDRQVPPSVLREALDPALRAARLAG